MAERALRVPPIQSVEAAVRIYWEYPDIGNKEMRELFGDFSNTKLCMLKRAVRELVREKGYMSVSASRVPTFAAYEAWGLDINALEERLTHLRKLGFYKKKPEEAKRNENKAANAE